MRNFYMSTMTQATRGRMTLASVGIRSFVVRNKDLEAGNGCGWVLTVPSDNGKAADVLTKNGVHFTRTDEKG